MTRAQQDVPIDIRILGEALVNPKAALMQLTLDIEKELRKLLVSSGHLKEFLSSSSPIPPTGLQILQRVGAELPQELVLAINEFWNMRNSAIHNPNFEVPSYAFDRGLKIFHILENVPRPRYVVKQANVPLFADRTCRIQRDDVVGVMLQTLDGQGNPHGDARVYPTHMKYENGQSVGWEWSDDFKNHVYGDAWYKDPTNGQCTLAWNQSVEFMGRDVNDV